MELSSTAVPLTLCATAAPSGQTSAWGQKLVVVQFSSSSMIFNSAPISSTSENATELRIASRETVLEGTQLSPADTRAAEKTMNRGGCTTELYSQMDCTRFFDAEWNTTQIFTEQKRFQECRQLKLRCPPAFSQVRPQNGCIPANIPPHMCKG